MHFEIWKIPTITLCAKNLIAISRKSTSESIFFEIESCNLGLVVLVMLYNYTKLIFGQIFDLGPRNEDVEFKKCPPYPYKKRFEGIFWTKVYFI